MSENETYEITVMYILGWKGCSIQKSLKCQWKSELNIHFKRMYHVSFAMKIKKGKNHTD